MHHTVSGINSQIHSVSLASHVSTRLFIHLSAQFISVIIHTVIIRHSFTLSSRAQNLPLQQILLALILRSPKSIFVHEDNNPRRLLPSAVSLFRTVVGNACVNFAFALINQLT